MLEQSYRQAKELKAEEWMPGMLVTGWNATGKNTGGCTSWEECSW
ncbi:hypothetical protein J23TS9_26860 [Paenibacillus sp. J23TS9]|nr:hypothetical protein J23TS9_26860 [Paenibacillus sp. J23TS9]